MCIAQQGRSGTWTYICAQQRVIKLNLSVVNTCTFSQTYVHIGLSKVNMISWILDQWLSPAKLHANQASLEIGNTLAIIYKLFDRVLQDKPIKGIIN